MAKIGGELVFTFRIGELSLNQFAKVRLSVDEVDTGVNLNEQLPDVKLEEKPTPAMIYAYIKSQIDRQITDIQNEVTKES